ncbi:hypothetical protein IWW36_003315 [Coemansia brasiliensis]|uniref:Sepiapterin reductase n=1 Tax=Coemansia brasiliensis TaxID=2650707 RepID=A0A9W8I5M6_9FUNG|nr:hypothetical protein IWW36_003315 [Coemansia brasiliensis]
MSKKLVHLYIVTGATGGLGEALVQALARHAADQNEERHMVLVGRNQQKLESISIQAANAHLYCVPGLDLKQPPDHTTSQIMAKFRSVSDAVSPTYITLIHCAGSIGDLSKTVGQYTADEIVQYTTVNFTSYCTLTSQFLNFTTASTAQRISIVNISSLLAVCAFANWGLYASIKAARDQLLKVVAKENTDGRVKTLSYSPGPLDNSMQQAVRETIGDKEQQDTYAQLHRENKLVAVDTTANLLCTLLDKWEFESGAHIDIFDLVPPPA